MKPRSIVTTVKFAISRMQVKDEGYEIEHDGYLITIFSAPNYCDVRAPHHSRLHLKRFLLSLTCFAKA